MATARKKLDELNLKTLRELVGLPQNKFCFDCGQRGPTYVNVTVGSFVCTKCSGILRGITPPHRVKSISMATFSLDEIETLRSKGNGFCKKVWLGLYEGTPPIFSDEQLVRDFMIEKYEKKRFYLEKSEMKTTITSEVPNTKQWSTGSTNGTSAKLQNGTKNGFSKISTNHISNGTFTNGTTRSRPEVKNHHQNGTNNNNLGNGFAVDFDKAEIFNNAPTISTKLENGFADFEHNQVYNANSDCNNGTPTPSNLNAWASTYQTPLNPQNSVRGNSHGPANYTSSNEDKYAALKDLDNEMKQQQHQDVWSTSTNSSTGSLYSSSTPNTGSAYGSPSPQSSIFGSPSQGQFMSAFNNLQENNSQIVNPFGISQSSSPWSVGNGFSNGYSNGPNGLSGMNALNSTQSSHGQINPFQDQLAKSNGLSNGVQSLFPSDGMKGSWSGNPFKLGTVSSSMNINNPFL
uniref:Arf-GAP domain-containing protein n=1 Tax=Dendroctonus ponderosae TaxID=77166 RepID=A0AAR5Q291_DENPD